ncbi:MULTISPECIES: RagB/SusD family nutrient uptake outer membrane protein [Flavobacterium]|uniref:RagB/SusD family nutrient uptake outer membrane protein n=1 Tax=Flavobacterium commune TaxID=1306519 RepID=A0A1D9PE83_9FLAO|nr:MULTISPECIES: RagB/SusD family nutrient uptake outer membrane protein [Flavobacterium]AOZ97960.1 RagB/SusD family nutrient uptake outer membrane protein [Flavobacterium commune]APA00798.1 RagB/SusD family nutrient uptake outer membrane protein [Flavobacterium commune]
MKNIYIGLLLVSIFTSSCEDFLNTEPKNKIALEQYYTDEEGLTQALAGVYDPLGSDKLYGNAMYTTLEACTDEGYYARSAQVTGTQVYNFDPTAADVAGLWSELYNGINRANDLIANINVPKMDENKREVILGEALFLRGYYYFMLVTRFGEVPLKTTPTTSPNGVQIAKSSIAEVYAQILKDMTEAEAKVGTVTSYGYSSRISKTAVQGILARVCLQMAGYPLMDSSKYADALAWSKKVIDSGEHSLNVSFDTNPALAPFNPTITANTSNNGYRQIFINQAQDIYDVKECIWEIDFKGNRTDSYTETGRVGNTNGITMTGVNFESTIGYSYGFIKGTGRLFNKYGTGDLRRDWVLTTYTFNNNTGAKTAIAKTMAYGRDCGKWRREYEILTPKNKNHTPINFPVLRYADVLLMYAEAENQVNGPTEEAVEAVNKVRRRGYGQTNLTLAYPTSDVATATAAASKSAFQLFIEDERMRELCFEGTRRSDLIRWNKFVSTMNAVGAEMSAAPTPANQQYGGLGGRNVTARNVLFPIPSVEILSNKALTQSEPWLN